MSTNGDKPRRTVLFVAAEFPPCNLTAGHRTRLFANHLREFGYNPIVLTVEPRFHESTLDPALESLVFDGVEVIRTRALPTKPIRLLGDIGVRSFPFFLTAMRRVIRERKVDVVYLPIPPFYSALLGPAARYICKTPFAIDYIDPWVRPATELDRRSFKGVVSHRISALLEPIALCGVAGITGVAERYYEDVFERHPRLRKLPSAGIPYGGEAVDHEVALRNSPPSTILNRTKLQGRTVLAYCGAMLPKAYDTLRTLLVASRRWVESGDPAASRLTLLFVGTGLNPIDPASGPVMPVARECGADTFVVEVAERQPYLEVLRLLHHVHGVMILGSSERHYTASKTFQALMSQRPILALLHADSTAAQVLINQPAVQLVTFDDASPVAMRQEEIVAGIQKVCHAQSLSAGRDEQTLAPYSARAMTRRLAAFFDDVLANEKARAHG